MDENINVITVDVNNEGDLCPQLDYPKYTASVADSLKAVPGEFQVEVENCDLFSVYTPFNGGYSRVDGPLLNGYPKYVILRAAHVSILKIWRISHSKKEEGKSENT